MGAMRRHLAASRELEHSLKNFVGLRSLDDFSANIYVLVHTTSAASREFGERRSIALRVVVSGYPGLLTTWGLPYLRIRASKKTWLGTNSRRSC